MLQYWFLATVFDVINKRGRMKKCYMCNSEGTTSEHVPPKCILPEKKGIPDGGDYKKTL